VKVNVRILPRLWVILQGACLQTFSNSCIAKIQESIISEYAGQSDPIPPIMSFFKVF